MVSIEKAISEFFDELASVKDILHDSKNRILGTGPLTIMLRQRLAGLITASNKIASIQGVSVEQECELMEQALSVMNEAIIGAPPDIDDLLRMELQGHRNSYVVSLMEAWGQGGILRVTGTAVALANILLGIQLIDTEPLELDVEDPGGLRRFVLIFNYVNMTAGLFYVASSSVYTSSRELVGEWLNVAVNGNWQFLQFIENCYDLRKFYAVYLKRHRGVSSFYGIHLALLMIFTQMIRYILIAHARLGGIWPESLDSVPFLSTDSTKSVLSSLVSFVDRIRGYQREFASLAEDGTFDRNDDPLGRPEARLLTNWVDLTYIIMDGVNTLHDILIEGEDNASPQLADVVQRGIAYLDERSEMFNDPDFPSSSFGEYASQQLEYFIYFAGVLCISTDSMTPLASIRRSLGALISSEGRNRFSKLYALLLTAELTVATRLRDRTTMKNTAGELLKQIEPLLFQPRHGIACSLQGHLTLLALGEIDPDTFSEKVNETIRENREYLHVALATEIEDYLRSLESGIRNQEAQYATHRLSTVKIFDPYTVLVPEFDSFAREQGFGTVLYLPFNLATDYILE